MILNNAIFYSECILSFGLALQSLEYYFTPNASRFIAVIRLIASLMILLHINSNLSEILLTFTSILLIYQYHGPYNGGSDCIATLLTLTLTIANILGNQYYKELAIGYFCVQLIYSYFQSGYVKLFHEKWRDGSALMNVFLVTAYPTTESIRTLSSHHTLLLTMGWFVIIFEILFPFSIINEYLLIIALSFGVIFHLANAILFGLNRFFWMWIAGYPLLLWFHERIFS